MQCSLVGPSRQVAKNCENNNNNNNDDSVYDAVIKAPSYCKSSPGFFDEWIRYIQCKI